MKAATTVKFDFKMNVVTGRAQGVGRPAQPANTWGNEGRNLLNAPGKWNFDLSLHREFRPTEAITLQFRWEAFDFTNTVTPAPPISVLGAPGFGRIVTFTGNRQQQIALKILF